MISMPWPRRRLGRSPNGSPLSRRFGTSGNVRRSRTNMRRLALPVGRRRRRELEAALADPAERLGAAEGARLREERRGEQEPVTEHRQEEQLDVVGNDMPATVQKRPRARGALERQAAADGRAGGDAFDAARRADELHDPAEDQVVDVDILDRALQRPNLAGVK